MLRKFNEIHSYLIDYPNIRKLVIFTDTHIIYIVRSLNIINQEIDKYYYQIDPSEFEFFYDTSYKVAERISQLKAGIYHIEQIGSKYDNSWFIGVGKAPDSENEKIEKAIAEWSDGDSVAAHIAIKGDYFCTKDVGKKGGKNSIFSKQNVAIIEKEYGFNKVSPLELLNIINKK